MIEIAHYCQNCKAANALGLEFCARCGTRLMLVVEPPAMRFEKSSANASHEEYLLERVSALENMLVRMTERLEQGLDLLLKQAQHTYMDHTLIETLIAVLHAAGTVDAHQVNHLWLEHRERDTQEQARQKCLDDLAAEISAKYHGKEQKAFAGLIQEGIALWKEDEKGSGLLLLERAAAMSPDNAALAGFIGEHFFQTRKTVLARDYLNRAHAHAPDDLRLCLLLGLVCADEGDLNRGGELLEKVAQGNEKSFAAHYGLGAIFIIEENWKEALAEFKRAHAAAPSPESHYLLGCIYYKLERELLAERHLQKALKLDGGYAEALYVRGLIQLRAGETTQAREFLHQAHAASGDDPFYRKAAKRRLRQGLELPLPALPGGSKGSSQNILTGVNERLAMRVIEDALSYRASAHRKP